MNAPANDDAVPVSSGNRPSIRPTSQLRTRVWIVDDSPVQAAVARQALAERCDVSVYASGTAAIEQLSLGEPSPDVLVLDWNMPEMSGEEVCLFVRGTFDAARLPILVLTATATSNGVLEALAAGANDFVRKPFTDTELTRGWQLWRGANSFTRSWSLPSRSCGLRQNFESGSSACWLMTFASR
jgi:CheY-like chemotaxis protein